VQATYSGPFDEVELIVAGRTWCATNGEPVEIPDEVAATLEGREDWTISTPKNPGRKATTTKDGDK